MLSEGTTDEKISVVFDVYDFGNTSTISADEMTILLLSSLKGITIMTKIGKEPSEERVEMITKAVSASYPSLKET